MMATEQAEMLTYGESGGRVLVRRRAGENPNLDDTWIVQPPADKGREPEVSGPVALARVFKFCPSDWHELEIEPDSPVFEAVERLKGGGKEPTNGARS
jgi:hypothetical protein